MGWFSIIAVDGTPYRLMGVGLSIETAEQVATIMTPTRTSFLFQAGPVMVNTTYLSPVEVCHFRLATMLYALYADISLAKGSCTAIPTVHVLLCISYLKLYAFH